MNYEIEIKVEQSFPKLDPDYYQITGLINGREEIILNNHVNKEWKVTSSPGLTGDLARAVAISQCFEEARQKMWEVRGMATLTKNGGFYTATQQQTQDLAGLVLNLCRCLAKENETGLEWLGEKEINLLRGLGVLKDEPAKFQIEYYKPSGKWYTTDFFEYPAPRISHSEQGAKESDTIYMYAVLDYVEQLRSENKLPGLASGSWDGPIRISHPHGTSVLIPAKGDL